MKPSGLKISITGMPWVKELCQLIIDTSKDVRIPADVRSELSDKVESLLNRMNDEG